MSGSEIEARVRNFIHEQFPVPDELPAEESLLEGGVIDSIGVLTLVTWLEQEFGFVIEDDEVVPDNLESVANLVRFVSHKLDESGLAA